MNWGMGIYCGLKEQAVWGVFGRTVKAREMGDEYSLVGRRQNVVWAEIMG